MNEGENESKITFAAQAQTKELKGFRKKMSDRVVVTEGMRLNQGSPTTGHVHRSGALTPNQKKNRKAKSAHRSRSN